MKVELQKKITIGVDLLTKINDTDLADLCNITEEAIKAGGGFGWLKNPGRNILQKYWKGVGIIQNRKLIVGRMEKAIAGTLQLIFQPLNNEAQSKIFTISSHFVAPWARGYGLAKSMIDFSELKAKEDNIKSIQLAVRETQDAAVQLFSSKEYKVWGENPYYAFINGGFVKGVYFYKNL